MTVVAMEFGPSPSTRIGKAVSIAYTFKTHTQRNDRHYVEAEVTPESWPRLRDLWGIIGNWRSTGCTIDGEAWIWHRWRAVGTIIECGLARTASGEGDLYCAGQKSPTHEPEYLGCRHTRGARIGEVHDPVTYESVPGWWCFGQLSPDNRSFLVDKEEIIRRVELHSKEAKDCPAWSPERLRAVVRMLPTSLAVGPDWKLRYSTLDANRPIGVAPVAPMYGSFYYRTEDDFEKGAPWRNSLG